MIVTQGFSASAEHQPADKVSASGSQAELVGAGVNTTILSETIKLSTPSDLLLGLTLECSIITDVFTTGDESQEVEATIKTWVTLDGKIVPVSSDDATDPGKVVFCNRAHRQDFDPENDSDDNNDTYETFQRTRQANAFSWVALDDGNYDDPAIPAGSTNNIIEVEVHATLTIDQGSICPNTAPDDTNCATGVIGHRSLVIEPVKSANDEAVSALS